MDGPRNRTEYVKLWEESCWAAIHIAMLYYIEDDPICDIVQTNQIVNVALQHV